MITRNTICQWMAMLQLLATSLCSSVSLAAPVIESHEYREGVLGLRGKGFGEACRGCEVIADYGSLKYALTVNQWSDKHILAELPDLNLATQVRLQVVTPGGKSNGVDAAIRRRIVPPIELKHHKQSLPRDFLILSRRSDRKVGDKGEEKLDVSSPTPACGVEAMLFDHARVVFAKRRFGDAQIIAIPKPGCTRCEPLSVRWYHEPTGHLDFQVHVYRRRVEGICANRRR